MHATFAKEPEPAEPNLTKQTYQTYQTYQTKPTKPNQTLTYQIKSNVAYQAYWTMPTKPKLLVKAVNVWVRSAFGNVLNYGIVFFNYGTLTPQSTSSRAWEKQKMPFVCFPLFCHVRRLDNI